jgi:hypothetical protein
MVARLQKRVEVVRWRGAASAHQPWAAVADLLGTGPDRLDAASGDVP